MFSGKVKILLETRIGLEGPAAITASQREVVPMRLFGPHCLPEGSYFEGIT